MSGEKCSLCGHSAHNDRPWCGEQKVRTIRDDVSYGDFPPSGKVVSILEDVCKCMGTTPYDVDVLKHGVERPITEEEHALLMGVSGAMPPKMCDYGCDPWSFAELCPEEKIEAMIDYMEEIGMRLEPWQAEAFRAIMKHDGPVRIQQGRR